MSWERRGNNYYYYYKFKSSNAIRSIYGGSGQRGVSLATCATELRAERDLSGGDPVRSTRKSVV